FTMLTGQPPFLFSRHQDTDAVGYSARMPPTHEARISAPVAGDDGWPVASLDGSGIDEKPLVALVEKILSADPTDNPVAIHSLLIARHGNLVFEEYFHGFSRDRAHDMRSS